MSDEIWSVFQRLGDRIAYGIGADRFERGAELQAVGVRTFVLDDGLQHLQLARDLEIVLIDASSPFGNGLLLPAGALREPKSALARADIVVITRTRHAPGLEAIVKRHTRASVCYAWPELEGVFEFRPSELLPAAATWTEIPLFAFCALGNPAGFLSNIREWHPLVRGHKVFPDHHRYTPDDWQTLKRLAEETHAEGFVCTEKDLYNLAFAFIGDRDVEAHPPRIFVPRIELKFSDAEAIRDRILSLLDRQAITR